MTKNELHLEAFKLAKRELESARAAIDAQVGLGLVNQEVARCASDGFFRGSIDVLERYIEVLERLVAEQ